MIGKITTVSNTKNIHRNSIGGYPVVPDGFEWPTCPQSGKEMVLFLQTDFDDGYHLTVFMSPAVNEIPCFEYIEDQVRLSDNFWNKREDHFKVYYFKGPGKTLDKEDSYLVYKRLEWVEGENEEELKLGGIPNWLQDPEYHDGPQGEKFEFVLQVPDSYPFVKKLDAPEQPDSFSKDDYCLFLGNQVYVFVSKEIAHPEATWIVVQN